MAEDKGKAGGSRRRAADKDEQDQRRQAEQGTVQVEPIADAEGSATGPERELAQTYAQPPQGDEPVASHGQWVGPPGSADPAQAVDAKVAGVGGEGQTSREDGVAAAQAGNEQVAERFQPEQEAGFRGLNPAAHANVEHTVAGHLAFQQLSPEEQLRRKRELHEANQANLRGDDWS